jgi:hypothetical protein
MDITKENYSAVGGSLDVVGTTYDYDFFGIWNRRSKRNLRSANVILKNRGFA